MWFVATFNNAEWISNVLLILNLSALHWNVVTVWFLDPGVKTSGIREKTASRQILMVDRRNFFGFFVYSVILYYNDRLKYIFQFFFLYFVLFFIYFFLNLCFPLVILLLKLCFDCVFFESFSFRSNIQFFCLIFLYFLYIS